jgi:H+/Cl- antiporter ClcA
LARQAGGFDNDRDRRNLVSMGAAAGVAAAFGAPIGGILFSLEEVSSFWDPTLTWTTFIAATIASFTVEAFRTAAAGVATIGGSHFGLVFSTDGSCSSRSSYAAWEVLPFVVIGLSCGLLGALFNTANTCVTSSTGPARAVQRHWKCAATLVVPL